MKRFNSVHLLLVTSLLLGTMGYKWGKQKFPIDLDSDKKMVGRVFELKMDCYVLPGEITSLRFLFLAFIACLPGWASPNCPSACRATMSAKKSRITRSPDCWKKAFAFE